jgi:hypothetical protein
MIEFHPGRTLSAKPPTFRLADYVDKTLLPHPPVTFGHEKAVASWGMLGNDSVGDCVLAGAAHEHMVWCDEPAPTVACRFDTPSVLKAYSELTGYVPGEPSTDRGTDMAKAASWRRKTGIADADRHVHKIAAYLALEAGNVSEILTACWLFGAVGVGLQLPAYAMDEFNAGRAWTVKRTNTATLGGHYVPIVAHRGDLVCVTWGRAQKMATSFLAVCCDESIAYVSNEVLNCGKSPEGFNAAQLLADLKALG